MLTIDHLSFKYKDHAVLRDISLTIASGETVILLGTSGVGKTTLFNLIASNLALQTGEILIDDSPNIAGKISYMLQKDMLFQHKTIIENVMLPSIIQHIDKKKAYTSAMHLLEQFDLAHWADYYPSALSGGMRQRVAFLRTANFQREWLLLDEAFSALDAITRRQTQKWFLNHKQQFHWSTLLITHDVEEALTLGDRIYVLKGQPGEIVFEYAVNFEKKHFDNLIFQPKFLEAKRLLLNILEH